MLSISQIVFPLSSDIYLILKDAQGTAFSFCRSGPIAAEEPHLRCQRLIWDVPQLGWVAACHIESDSVTFTKLFYIKLDEQ